MAKILLCHPLFLSLNPEEQALKSPYFPLGLLYLAGYVRAQGHTVAVFDGTFEEDVSAFSTRLAAEKPDLVGISALLPLREMALTLAADAKAAGALTILGGPDPTKDPASYLQFPQVDMVVHHEGEQTLDALLRLIDAGPLTPELLASEPGIAYRAAAGAPVVNQPRPLIESLDELPLPARDLIDMNRLPRHLARRKRLLLPHHLHLSRLSLWLRLVPGFRSRPGLPPAVAAERRRRNEATQRNIRYRPPARRR